MSIVTDNQREKELQSKLDGLLSRTSDIHREVLEATDELNIEVNRWRNLAKAAEKELEGVQAENRGLVSGIESIAADRKAMEGHFNEKVEELFAADEKLKSEIFWRSILFWLMALLAVIILIAGVLK